MEVESRDVEIRHISFRVKNDLIRILESSGDWKTVMASVPDNLLKSNNKYTTEDIMTVEMAGKAFGESCTGVFLDEWGTSGQVRPRLSTLLDLLKEQRLFRAADYVYTLLTGTIAEVERPKEGIGARVLLSDVKDLHVQTECEKNSNFSSDATVTPQFNIRNGVQSFLSDRTISCVSLDISAEKAPGQPVEISYNELERCSGNFSHCLGSGAFGSVFLCKLDSGLAAVKKLHISSVSSSFVSPLNDPQVQFKNEMLALTKFQHKNLLPLLAYSNDGPEVCLLFNYMPLGSLQDRLEAKDGVILSWQQRLSICTGAARGLHHLHSAHEPLIHRDIKTANILIDHDFTPKLGDFGLARLGPSQDMPRSSIFTCTIVGTTPYMSPEALRGSISVRMDVFSFGVVLLEIITGLPVFDQSRTCGDLLTHVQTVTGGIECLIDQRPKDPHRKLALKLYEISQVCNQDIDKRPYIDSILQMLENVYSSIK